MKLAMVNVQDRLRVEFPTAKQLLQIHDSILIECDETDASGVGQLLKETMEGVYKLPVHLDVDVTTGKNWGEL
jgi:DNA polymerase-1